MGMDKTVRQITNLEEQRAETYRYWRSRSIDERVNAIWDLSFGEYKRKGLIQEGDRLRKDLVHIERRNEVNRTLQRESSLVMRKSKV